MKRSIKHIERFLAPERLYTLQGFHEASGISSTRVREARLKGIVLPTLAVGRRRGSFAAAMRLLSSLTDPFEGDSIWAAE